VPAGLADRLIGPYVAEARAALADGVVADADLVDAGAIFGTGFAPFRGGPLHDAATREP
jgi:3-hydroxyacyl-CoA dehydrogenase/enoyl-CoA hydratase/3-hydroxybutyryl-CoA epimerase